MPLPVVKRIPDWEVYQLFSRKYDIDKLLVKQIQLKKLITIARQYEQRKEAYLLGASICYSLLSDAAKPNELPIVSKATLDSTLASFFGSNIKEKGIESWKRIKEDNEEIYLVSLYVLHSGRFDEEEQDWLVKGIAQIYEFLHRQQEANDMEELFV